METKGANKLWDGRKRCSGLLPLLPAGSNKTSQANWVLNKKQSKGSGLSKQVPPAPALGCIQRTIKNHVCGVLHAQLTVGADARLPGLALPPARFLSTPMGAGAQLRQRLPLLPPPHRLQVGLAPAQCRGHQARAPHLPHIVLQLAGALARWLWLSAAPAGAPARSPPAHRFRLPVLTGWPTLAGRQWLAGRACQVSSFAATYARCRVLPPPMPGVAATAGGAAPGRYRGVGVLDTLVRIVRDWHCHTLDLQQLPLAEGACNANCPNSCHTRQRPRGEEAI